MAEKQTKIVIGAEVSQAEAALKRLNGTLGQMEQAATRLKNPFQALGPYLLNPVVAATAGVTALGAAIKKTADAGEEMGKFAQQAGVSVEWISGMKYAAEQSETSVESLVTALGLLSKGLAEGGEEGNKVSDALKALGVSAKNADGSLRPTEALFADIAEKFAGMQDGAGKTALAMNLFGRSGKELIPLLNGGASGIEAMRKEAQRLGIVMSTDAAKAADNFNDNLARLGKHFDGMVHTIGNSLIPALNRLFELFEGKGPSEQTRLSAIKRELENLDKQIEKTAASMGATGQTQKRFNDGYIFDWMGDNRSGVAKSQQEGQLKALLKLREQLAKEGASIEKAAAEANAKKTPAPIIGSDKESKGKTIAELAEEHRLALMKQEEKEAEERRKRAEAEQDSRRETWQRTTDALKQIEEGLTEFGMDEIDRRVHAVDEWAARMQDLLLKAGLAHEEYEETLTEITRKATAERAKITEDAYDDAIKGTKKRTSGDEDAAADFWTNMQRATENWHKDLTNAIDDALMNGEGSFEDFFIAIGAQFRKILIDELISKQLVKALQGAIDEGLSGLIGVRGELPGGKGLPGGLGSLFSGGSLSGFLSGGGLTGDFFSAGLLGSSGFAAEGAALMNLFTMHDGGPVAYVPRFHFGGSLAPDERHIIGRTDEYMMSGRGVRAAGLAFLDRLNAGSSPSAGSTSSTPSVVNINIYAQDSEDVRRFVEKHQDVFVGASINNINRNGALRSAIVNAT